MYNITIQNAFFMAQFIVAIVQNTFITVEEIARFLNIILGTKTITSDSVNNMLIQAKYQILTDKKEFEHLLLEDNSIIFTKYSALGKAKGLYKVEYPLSDDEDFYLKWSTDIIIKIFEIDDSSSIKTKAKKMIIKAIQYNLINVDKDFIDIKTVTSNLGELFQVVNIGFENYKKIKEV